MIHCALDLELEQPYTNRQTPDSKLKEETIIQVGYVIYELEPFQIIKSVSDFININVPLSAFIKNLTGITDEQISKGITIEESYEKLRENQKIYDFCRVIKQWGSGDMNALKKEVPNSPWSFGRSGCNIKHLYQIYAEANGLNRSGGLARSMRNCKLRWQGGQKHNAEADALNTAYFHSFLHERLKNEIRKK